MKVTVGQILSHGFPVPVPFHTAWTRFLYALLTGDGNSRVPESGVRIDRARVLESYGFPIDVARNELCRQFLDHDDGDYLLFVDADMVMPPDLAHVLLQHQLPIVTGRYDLRKPPYSTVAMLKTGPGPRDYQAVSKLVRDQRGLIPIDAAGAGALLIRRDVLATMRAAIGDNWFQYQIGTSGFRDVSEDMWFFEQAKSCGFQAYLDADVYSQHIAQHLIQPSFQTICLAELDRALASQDAGAA